jgi:copper homeostasis protein
MRRNSYLKDMRIEVCVDNIMSLSELINYKIDRIEICSALGLDGLTPSLALVKYAKEYLNTELHIMLRPRSGNFFYSSLEILEICRTLEEFATIVGIDGVVFGCLTEDLSICVEQAKEIIRYAEGYNLETTFHRAIDMSANYFESIQTCIDLGINRILTSGGKKDVTSGLTTLKKIVSLYGKDIEIMAGSGINIDNIGDVINTGVDALHFSASKIIKHGVNSKVFSESSLSYVCLDREKLETFLTLLEV